MSKDTCPTTDELSRYAVGRFDEQQRERISEHVDTCTDCQAELETVNDSSDTLVASLRERSADPYEAEPQCQDVLERIAEFCRDPSMLSVPRTASVTSHVPELEQIREYKVLAKLGEGGMGTVYKALHTKLKKIVAVKVLPTERMMDEQAVFRFEREMEAVGKLEHANIVRATDAGEHEGKHFLVMELVDGIDLSALVKQVGPLNVADACELVRQAAIGLEEAHEHHMVHRDIKPSNLMLAARKRKPPIVKILDMGLALLDETHGEQRGLTSTGQMMGTLDYMAPEQGINSHEVDIRADIYSLGATLRRLLTGQSPYPSDKYDSPMKLMMALANEPIPSIAGQRGDLPPGLVAIVDRMLAKSPEDRFETPKLVAEALLPFTEKADLAALLQRSQPSNAETLDQSAIGTHVDYKSGSHDTASSADRVGTRNDQRPGAKNLKPLQNDVEMEAIAGQSSLSEQAVEREDATLAKPGRLRRYAIVTIAGVIGITLLAILLTIRLGDVTVTVETPDGKLPEDVKIVLRAGDDEFEISAKNKWRLRVSPDDYSVDILGGNDRFVIQEKRVLISRSGKNIIKVTRKPPAPATAGKIAGKSEPATFPPRSPRKRSPAYPTDAELLERLAAVDWTPGGSDTRLGGYLTQPTHLPGLPNAWQIVSTFPHATLTPPSVSPKGNYLAVAHGDYDPFTRILERRSGKLIGMFHNPSRYQRRIAWSADEKHFAMVWGGWGSSVATVCGLDGVVQAQWQSPVRPSYVAWNPVGAQILLADDTAIEQRTSDGKLVATFTPPGHGGACFWSPDGSQFAVETDGAVLIYSANGGKPIATFKVDHLKLYFGQWHPDGKRFLTNGKSKWSVRIWTTPSESTEYEFHRNHETFSAFSPDGQFLLTNYGQIRDLADNVVSNIELTRPFARQSGEGAFISRWIEDDRICLVANYQQGDSVERSPLGRNLAEYHNPMPMPQHSLSWTAEDSLHSIAGSHVGSVRRYFWSSSPLGDRSSTLKSTTSGLVAFSPSGDRYVSQDSPNAVHDQHGKQLYKLSGDLAAGIRSWSADGQLLATASHDIGPISVWQGQNRVARFEARKSATHGMAWNPNSRHLASWDLDGNVFVWNVDAPEKPLATLKGVGISLHNRNYFWDDKMCPSWSPDGKRLAVFTEDSLLFLSNTGEEIGRLPWKKGDAQLLWWRPDSTSFVVGNQIYDIDGKTVGEIGTTHGHDVLLWLKNGGKLGVSGRTVRFWDQDERTPTQITLPGFGHESLITKHTLGMNARRVSSSDKQLAHLVASHDLTYGGDVSMIDIEGKRLAWTGLGYTDGTQIRIEPTGRVLGTPENVDRYLAYVIQYPTGRVLPLTQLQFAARIGLPEGQQLIQRTLDFGGKVTAVGRNEPFVSRDFQDARELPGVADVVALDLSGNDYLNDGALAHLGELTSLERLVLQNTSVTDAGLRMLQNLKRLRALNISGLKTTDAIGTMLPASLEELDVSHTNVGDFLLYELRRFKSLTRLVVTNTKVTSKGIEDLRRALPSCEVVN